MKTIKHPIVEARRYISNSKSILDLNGKIDNEGYYSDKKYMKIAGHTSYVGVLEAIQGLIKQEFPETKNKRHNDDFYREFLAKRNRKMVDKFNSIYNVLHILCGYEGELKIDYFKLGIKTANEIIDWCETQIKIKVEN